MNKDVLDPGYQDWIEGEEPIAAPGMLAAVLDRLLLAGPGQASLEGAQQAARTAWEQAAGGVVFYDVLRASRVGDVYIALSAAGVAAIDFGCREEDFLGRISRAGMTSVQRSSAVLAEPIQQVAEYLEGARRQFELPLDLAGLTSFQRLVLETVAQVPPGQVVSYGELARRIGKPRGARAVGQALGRNPVPIVIPCHRVLAGDGSMGGYSGGGGVQTKRSLLLLEGALQPGLGIG